MRSTAVSTSHAPFASTRSATPGPIASRTAATRSRSPGYPTFTFTHPKPRSATGVESGAGDESVDGDRCAPSSFGPIPRPRPRRAARPGGLLVARVARQAGSTPPSRPDPRSSVTARSPMRRRCSVRTGTGRTPRSDRDHDLEPRRRDERGDERRRIGCGSARGAPAGPRAATRGEREERPRLGDADRNDRTERSGHAGDEQATRGGRSDAHRERALPRDDVGRDVAHVVGEQDRAREQPDRERAPPRRARHALELHVTPTRQSPRTRRRPGPSARRDRGSRTASGRPCRARPPRSTATPSSEQPRIDGEREHEPGDRRDAEREHRRGPHRAGRREPGRGEPQRAGAVLVGAAHAVGVVVRVVDADLQARARPTSASAARHQMTPSASGTAAHVPTTTGAIAAPSVRGRAPPSEPAVDGRRGCATRRRRLSGSAARRFGNRSNSGRRFSR